MLDDLEDMPWPDLGQKLFTDDAKGVMSAHLGTRAYAAGYERAAEVLVAYVRSSQGSDADLLVYPITFAARHAIELAIKDLAQLSVRLFDDLTLPKRASHRIEPYWLVARAALRRVSEPANASTEAREIDAVDSILHELASVDPDSTAFRYATDNKGRSTLGDRQWIDLERLQTVAAGVIRYLDAAHTYLSELHAASDADDWV